jgi:uncharacterized protein YndB with AHSA1/START domain
MAKWMIGAAVLLLTAWVAVAESGDSPAQPKLGEYWYGMYNQDGESQGYARLLLRETTGGGFHCEWELKVAFPGGTHEEERGATFHRDLRQTFAEFKSGLTRVVVAREGDVMVGKHGVDDLRVEVAADAIGGMGFVLAAAMPLEADATLSRTEYNTNTAMQPMGAVTFQVGEQEELELPAGKMSAWRVTMTRESGRPAPTVWVNAEREIVQVDWGMSMMRLHRESTRSLFDPPPPFLTQLEPDDKTKLVLTGRFPGFGLDEMWEHWTTADGITKWWPHEAEIEPEVGGKVKLTWRDDDGEIQWQLEGKVEVWEPESRFGFTWRWHTAPEGTPDLSVLVEFSRDFSRSSDRAVNVKITHGPFDIHNDDQENRAGLHQGWEYFCTKLAALRR